MQGQLQHVNARCVILYALYYKVSDIHAVNNLAKGRNASLPTDNFPVR